MKLWWQRAREPRSPLDASGAPEGPFPTETVRPGVYHAIQLVIQSERDDAVVDVKAAGWTLRAPQIRGVDRHAHEMRRTLPLPAGQPTPLWLLIEVPLTASGPHAVRVDVRLGDGAASIDLPLLVEGEPDYGHGEDDMRSLARLAWLDSRLGCQQTVTRPFHPIEAKGSVFRILGRDVEIGENGLPCSLCTRFTGINDALADEGVEMLDAPIEVEVFANGIRMPVTSRDAHSEGFRNGTEVMEVAILRYGDLWCVVTTTLGFDGWMNIELIWRTRGKTTMQLDDIRFPVRLRRPFARWISGLGTMATTPPERYEWKWDPDKHQDAIYCGGMNGGLVIRPVERPYVRPFCNIYYKMGPKNQPAMWVNGGRGGFVLSADDDACELCYYTGALTVEPEKTYTCSLDIGFTPFKMTDPAQHRFTRYFHAPGNDDPTTWIDKAGEIEATHVVVHHGKDMYPYINYPMYDAAALGDFVRDAHARYLRVKPYYTVREITSRMPEYLPFLAFGDEIFARTNEAHHGVPGQGSIDPYLLETAGPTILPAWKHAFTSGKYAGTTDPSVIVNPDSRIVNFYIEGLRWMLQRLDIDGIYIDDTGLDRHDMQRVRRVLDAHKPYAKIDLHSWNHFHDDMGEAWGHNAVMYAELFPYIDSLWFGEDFDFDAMDPLHMLVECSGLPFGLMSEMLQGGGNPWRGLLFGMTARAGYDPRSVVEPIWAWSDAYDIDEARMRGWWEERPLVVPSRPDVLVTAYEKDDEIAVVCASFATEPVAFTLAFADQPAEAYLPAIERMQEGREASPLEAFEVQPGGGVIVHFRV